VPSIDQVLREQAAAAPELDDEPFSGANRLQKFEDPRCAEIRMEPEPEMVHEGKVALVVRNPRIVAMHDRR
jgi:hypothetical protein